MLLGTRQLGAAWHPHDWHLEVSRGQPGGGLDTSNILCLLHLLCFSVTGCFSRLGMTFQSLWQLPLWSIPARPTGASNINLAQNCVFIAFYWTECCWTLSILLLETGLSRMVQTVRWDISKITHQLFFTFLHFAGRAGSDSDCQNNGGENCQCCQR